MTLSIANLPDEQRTTVEFADYRMDDDAFYEFCHQNEHLKFEKTVTTNCSDGTIVAMPNTGGKAGIRIQKLLLR